MNRRLRQKNRSLSKSAREAGDPVLVIPDASPTVISGRYRVYIARNRMTLDTTVKSSMEDLLETIGPSEQFYFSEAILDKNGLVLDEKPIPVADIPAMEAQTKEPLLVITEMDLASGGSFLNPAGVVDSVAKYDVDVEQ